MRVITRAIIPLCLLLSGCVSETSVLRNQAGQTVDCSQWGFGLIGAPVAMAAHSDCMKKAQAAGYSEAPAQAITAAK